MAYLTYDDFEIEDGYIYVIKVLGYCKIGKTKNPENRFGEYTMLMKEPKVVLLDYVSDYHRLELDLHKAYEHKRARGEWFKLSEKDIEDIKFMLDCYHVKNDREQMNNLIIYLSKKLCINAYWTKKENGQYFLGKFVGKNGTTGVPIFPVSDCKNAKEVQIEVLRQLSEKEELYQAQTDVEVLSELVEEDKTNNELQQATS